MNLRFPSETRAARWRERFLEIARQAEASARPAMPAGLRPRSRMAGFAALRQARPNVRLAG